MNWYKKIKKAQIEQEPQYSIYNATIYADITIPTMKRKETEKEVAYFVLKKYLPQSEDASLETAIDSYVKLTILPDIKPSY